MKAYGLPTPSNGRFIHPAATGNTAEFVMDTHDMSLVEHLVSDGNGGFNHRYRLHTRFAARFEDTLEYDIGCPRCNGMLRLCGRPLDRYDHGLYKCPVCDKH